MPLMRSTPPRCIRRTPKSEDASKVAFSATRSGIFAILRSTNVVFKGCMMTEFAASSHGIPIKFDPAVGPQTNDLRPTAIFVYP